MLFDIFNFRFAIYDYKNSQQEINRKLQIVNRK